MFAIEKNNWSFIFQHQDSLAQQAEQINNEKIETATMKDVEDKKEQTAARLHDKEWNDRPKATKEDDEIIIESLATFDALELSLHRDEMNDQEQETMEMSTVHGTNINFKTNNQRMVDTGITEENHQCTNRTNDIEADLEPIVGYAAEPLLPLAEACAPLIDIIHDVMVYVQMALDETPEEPPDGLTIDESAAIRLYTIEWSGGRRSLYSILNHTLKTDNREHLQPYFKYMKLFLTALAKLPCVPPSTVWRGVTKNISANFPPGTPVIWWAFSS
ncbi:unnamed protein product, partial [Adineta steineri]